MGRRRESTAALHTVIRRRRPARGVLPRLGLALGGGFARGIAHAGVLKVFERRHPATLHPAVASSI